MPKRLCFSGLCILPLFLFSCGGSSDNSGGGGGGSPSSLDGMWDITSYTTGGLAEMSISGGTINGVVVDGDEGKAYDGMPDCIATKHRAEFTISASGNAVTGSRTRILQATGAGCPEFARDRTDSLTFSGVRTHTDPASDTNLNGTWTVTGEGEAWNATFSGVTATATSTTRVRRPGQDTLTISVAGNTLSVGSTDNALSWSARKR